MTKRKNVSSPASGSVLFIPLNTLKKSPRNARKTPHTKAEIAALAASIKANGILQNPVVEPETNASGTPTGFYLVTIGEGRRQAQLLRATKKEIAKDEPIRCMVDDTHNALEISLAENAIRAPMHPADQFEAFFELHRDHGMNAEDIAARFGVTPAVVKQRLKLATVSPKLIALYRKEEMNLDQLTAYAITDDHARQEAVWEEFGAMYEREDILAALNGEHVPADDRRAVFVGLKAYQKAGGTIVRDLFDDEHQGFLTDPALLDRLAAEKLQAVADSIRAEGWKWVEVMPRLDHSASADMRRVYPQPVALTKKQEKQLAKLAQEYDALDPDADNVGDEIERIEGAMEALQQGAFDPADIARAGGFVSLGSDGQPRIERGFIRPEDDDEPTAKPAKAAKQPGQVAPLSEKLVAELTAQRTLALRDALGDAPDLALTALVHALAAATFFPHSGAISCIKVSAHSQYLGGHAPGIEETSLAQHLQARHERFAAQMPENPDALWGYLRGMEPVQQLALLAHCVSLTVDAVKAPKRMDVAEAHADQLFQALDYDMASVWTPTTANYLGRVSKERILEAVREGVSKEAAENLATMKKQAMAEAAEQRLKDRRWLPPVLRTPPVVAMAAE
jgi:ParB family transcriptional regulator, chromosome partitioning protein